MEEVNNNTGYDNDELDIRDIITIIWNGKILVAIITLVALLISILYSFAIADEKYESHLEFQVLPISFSEMSIANSVTVFDEINNKISLTTAQNASMIKSQKFAEAVAEKLGVDAKQFAKMLSVSADDKTNTISVKVTSTDPDKAYSVASVIVEEYGFYLQSHIKDTINEYVTNTDKNTSIYEAKLNDLRQELTSFRETYGEIDLIQTDLNTLKARVENLNQEILVCKASIETDVSSLDTVIKQLNTLGVTELSTSNLIAEIKAQTTDKDSSTNNILDIYLQLDPKTGDSDIAASALTLDLNRLQLQLIDNLNRNNALEKQLSEVKNTYSDTLETYLEIKPLYEAINTKYEHAVATYNTYSTRLNAINTLESIDIVSSYIKEITSPNMPDNPSSPNKKLNIAISLVLGIMLGVFIVLFKNYWKYSKKQ